MSVSAVCTYSPQGSGVEVAYLSFALVSPAGVARWELSIQSADSTIHGQSVTSVHPTEPLTLRSAPWPYIARVKSVATGADGSTDTQVFIVSSLSTTDVDGSSVPDSAGAYEEVFNLQRYGGDPTGALDSTHALARILAITPQGATVFAPRGTYSFRSLTTIATQGVTIYGESGPLPSQPSTIFRGDFPAYLTGTTGQYNSVTAATGSGNTDGNVIVTITQLTGVTPANTSPGDVILISNALNEKNNGAKTIISVGTDTVTAYCHYLGTHTSFDSNPSLPDLSDGNNGSFHWSIGRPMFRAAGLQNVTIKGITFNGNGTVGTIFDVSNPGTNGVPNNSIDCTAWRFEDCAFEGAMQGVKQGDFSTYVAGNITTTNISYPDNCDLFVYDNCAFNNMSDAGWVAPSSTGQTKLNLFIRPYFTNCRYGARIRFGSWHVISANMGSNGIPGVGGNWICYSFTDASTWDGGSSESSSRDLIFGLQGFASGFVGAVPVRVSGYRSDTDDAHIASDGRYLQFGVSGGISLQNCTFSAYGQFPIHNWYIAVNTIPTSAGAREDTFTADGCTFPSIASVLLAGTATLTNGSATVTFTNPQTFPAGTAFYFPTSSQPTTPYYLASGLSGTSGTLTQPWGGTGASGLTITTALPTDGFVQRNGVAPSWWSSHNCHITTGTFGTTAVPIPDGRHQAIGNSSSNAPGTWPTTQIPLISQPESPIALANGTHNDMANPYSSSVVYYGATGAVTITGWVAPQDGTEPDITFTFDFAQTVQVNNNDAGSAPGNRVLTTTGANVTMSAAAFNTCRAKYSQAKAAWRLLEHS